jgi:uroporphyrinogen decarboxylase
MALNHQEPDRVPIAFGGPECSIHSQAHANLLRFLGYAVESPAPVIDAILQIVEPDARLIEHFDVDVLWLVPREAPVQWGTNRETYEDEFGRVFRLGGGFYNPVGFPLKGGMEEELRHYRFPDLSAHDRVRGLAEKARRLHSEGYGLVADGPWGLYEISSSLRGTEELFVDMALNPGYVEALAERVLEDHLKPYYELILREVGPWVQMVVISDDYGSQESLLFSPRTFRTIYKPRLKRLVEHIRGLVNARIYIHSDGAVADLIPDFIEIGLDGLNPVQYTARGMEADTLKREFGQNLGFFGGGIDNEILSRGSIKEVQQNVHKQVAALAPGGGYLFATIHNIPPEVPSENVVAFFAAGADCGRYPFRG